VTDNLPVILAGPVQSAIVTSGSIEVGFLEQAGRLFAAGFYDHCLLDLWNASVANLRKRVEAYGVDLFLSVVKDEPGRKKYDKDGETPSERWQGVDDLVLVQGATALGLLNKKAGKSLEMINWMRNHASPAHGTDHSVEREDVIGLALILQKNLFEAPMPEAGHSVSSLFEPVKNSACTGEALDVLKVQIGGLRMPDVRIAFGFMLDMLLKGEQPALANVEVLLPEVWARANDDLKLAAGLRYHQLLTNHDLDPSRDRSARPRLLDFLTAVGGVRYIPEAARAAIYRTAAANLALAKNTSYGWANEEAAAKTLRQFGTAVPSVAFEDVYQEILAVWCGNFWGRSTAFVHLTPFIEDLTSPQIVRLAHLFTNNERVRSELFQPKPSSHARALLKKLRERLTIETHKAEVTRALESLDG